jgi:hypothetical protein
MVIIKEAPKITKPKKIGTKSLIPIDTILFFMILNYIIDAGQSSRQKEGINHLLSAITIPGENLPAR